MAKLEKGDHTDNLWIKEEDVKFMEEQLEDIRDCLEKGDDILMVRVILDRCVKYYDKNGRVIIEGDIINIGGCGNGLHGVYGVRDDGGIFNLETKTVYIFLEEVDKNLIKVIGQLI